MNIDIATITISPVERAYLTKSDQKQEQAQVEQESKPISESQRELRDQRWKEQRRGEGGTKQTTEPRFRMSQETPTYA